MAYETRALKKIRILKSNKVKYDKFEKQRLFSKTKGKKETLEEKKKLVEDLLLTGCPAGGGIGFDRVLRPEDRLEGAGRKNIIEQTKKI